MHSSSASLLQIGVDAVANSPDEQVRGLAQRSRAVDAGGGQGGGSIARTGANQALAVLAADLDQAVGRLGDAESIDVIHLGAVLGAIVGGVGDYVVGIGYKGWAVARIAGGCC